MKKFDRLYKILMENISERLWIDEDGNTVTEAEVRKGYEEALKTVSIDPDTTFEQYIEECEGKNGSLTRADNDYVNDILAKKLKMSYKVWQDAQQILYLDGESTNWGGREPSHTVNPEGKIDAILENYFEISTWKGQILGGPDPIGYMQLVIYCEENGFTIGFPDKERDAALIEELRKQTDEKDLPLLEELLQYWD